MKKKVFLFGLLFSLLLLCGCGVNLTSTVKLNKDFSGTRVMSCTFSSRDFHSYFKGSKEDLNKLIKESCPDALTYTSSSSDGNDAYTFYLRFSSLDDYKKKVRDLLNFSPEITYEYGDSPFVSGLIYKENFTSKDLMTWLYTALYEGKYIDKDSSSDLWDLKSTEISFLGTTYETKDKINIDEMAYVPLSSIHIDTKTKKSGKLARVIEFDLPQQTLDQNAERSVLILLEMISIGKIHPMEKLYVSVLTPTISLILHRKQELSFIQRILLELTAPHAARTTLLH